MAYKPREIEKVINGRMVVARPRRTEIEVDVYSGPEKTGDPVGEWAMPKVLGILLAMETAASQTPKETP